MDMQAITHQACIP